jgi:hypothetical protein
MTTKKGNRVLSASARRRMGEAGFKNLNQYRVNYRDRTREVEQNVDAFRASLLRDAGANPSASKLGLIEACVLAYAGIVKLRHTVIHSTKGEALDLTERVSWLTSNMARLLKQLGLDTRARPRSLSEVFARKGVANASKAPESGGNPA